MDKHDGKQNPQSPNSILKPDEAMNPAEFKKGIREVAVKYCLCCIEILPTSVFFRHRLRCDGCRKRIIKGSVKDDIHKTEAMQCFAA